MPKLLINEGGQASVFELFDDEATIGRGASNAIQIVDDHASKHHAVIRRAAGRVKLVDLESKNGTRVNGEFRNQRWLQHGDAVSIGAAVLTYDGSDASAVVEEPQEAAAFVGGGGGMGGRMGGGYADAVSAPTSRGPAPRSRRDRERDEGDREDRPRRSSQRSSNNAGTVAVIGGGLLLVVGLFFMLLSGKGNPANTTALAYARRLSKEGGATPEEAKAKVQAALDYLTQKGDPSDVDSYVSVEKEMKALKESLIAFDETIVESDANHEYKLIENAFIELWKNGRTQESIGQDLVKWATKYKGTRALGSFEAGNKDPKLLVVYRKAKEGGFAPPK